MMDDKSGSCIKTQLFFLTIYTVRSTQYAHVHVHSWINIMPMCIQMQLISTYVRMKLLDYMQYNAHVVYTVPF